MKVPLERDQIWIRSVVVRDPEVAGNAESDLRPVWREGWEAMARRGHIRQGVEDSGIDVERHEAGLRGVVYEGDARTAGDALLNRRVDAARVNE